MQDSNVHEQNSVNEKERTSYYEYCINTKNVSFNPDTTQGAL